MTPEQTHLKKWHHGNLERRQETMSEVDLESKGDLGRQHGKETKHGPGKASRCGSGEAAQHGPGEAAQGFLLEVVSTYLGSNVNLGEAAQGFL